MATLHVYMNGYLVGEFIRLSTGAHQFKYDIHWLETPGARPISLSMPLQHQEYKGDEVYNFFDNLLPDNSEIRKRVVRRYRAESTQPFDLLSKIGQDSVGALQLVPNELNVSDIKKIEYRPLSDEALEKVLNGYKSDIPLGMIEEVDDFRISIAGAQEKTALLYFNDQWCLPLRTTPTTHIIKLPIGEIQSHSHTLDMSDSVENEFLCLLIAAEFGFDVPKCTIINVGETKALAVERFDRKFSADNAWIMRLPQEDFCQTLNVLSENKYQKDGGPGIYDIMTYLLGSINTEKDRYQFMKSQVLFWLLAATDGHAKNFSLFIEPEGRYKLTPFYDILSVYPVFGGKGLNPREAKLAMSLKGTKGTKGNKDKIEQIFPRHFFATAKAVGFDRTEMERIFIEFDEQMESVITKVRDQLPADFPEHIANSILSGLQSKATRLKKGWD